MSFGLFPLIPRKASPAVWGFACPCHSYSDTLSSFGSLFRLQTRLLVATKDYIMYIHTLILRTIVFQLQRDVFIGIVIFETY